MPNEQSVVSPSPRPMEELFRLSPERPREKTLVQGTVIAKGKLTVYVDIPPFGTGVILGQEYLNARDIIKEISVGDTVTAKVLTTEGEKGYIELSLKEAKQAIIWAEAKQAIEHGTLFNLTVKNANKGGLILEWQGLEGFLPASQLKPDHYPKIPDGDKEKIMTELQKLIGQTLPVYIINIDPQEAKLIFSEKAGGDNKDRQEIAAKYSLGDVVDGEVTGVVDFGVFIRLEENFEGLIHISEIDWALVENPRDHFKVGDKVQAKIIEIKDDKVSLSIKALKKNPWEETANRYHKGDAVKGVVIKYNKHGALVSIEEGVAGLVHVSEFGSEETVRQKLELGKTYSFVIKLFEPQTQKLLLSPVAPKN